MKKRSFQNMTLLAVLLLSISYGAVDSSDTTEKINLKTAIPLDINADKKMDTILCEITGESWNSPFTVKYTITGNGTEILSETSSDDAIDGEFGNANAMDWCKDYMSCKKKWYVKKLPKDLSIVIKQGDEKRENLFDTLSDMAIPSLAQKFYADSLGYSKDKASLAAKKLIAFLKKNDFVLITIPANPVYRPFPRLYDPFSKRFIQLFGY